MLTGQLIRIGWLKTRVVKFGIALGDMYDGS